MSRRWSDVTAVGVAIAIIAGLMFALRPQSTPTIEVAASAAVVDRPGSSDTDHPSVLFVGDSYTAGNGLQELSPGCVAATRLGWLCHLSAVPGTGYISGGPANRFVVDPYTGPSTSFSERIPGLASVYQPDIVVLDGGRNDLFPPREDVFKAMAATIAEARRVWPSATLVVVRPRFLSNPDDDLGFDDAFMSRLLAQPGNEGVVVLDPISSISGRDTASLLADDGKHPNNMGELELASAFVASLRRQGLA